MGEVSTPVIYELTNFVKYSTRLKPRAEWLQIIVIEDANCLPEISLVSVRVCVAHCVYLILCGLSKHLHIDARISINLFENSYKARPLKVQIKSVHSIRLSNW